MKALAGSVQGRVNRAASHLARRELLHSVQDCSSLEGWDSEEWVGPGKVTFLRGTAGVCQVGHLTGVAPMMTDELGCFHYWEVCG